MPRPHLSASERISLEALLPFGLSQTEMALRLGRSKSTISRELSRNGGPSGRYTAVNAQRRYGARRAPCRPPKKLACSALRSVVEEGIREEWSPDQISNTLLLDFPEDTAMRVSYETIYAHVYADKRRGGTLHKGLRRKHKKRRNRSHSKDRRGIIKDRVPIHERPAIVETQARIGDWEGDTVIGKNHRGAVATFVDRKSLFLVAAVMPDKTAGALYTAALAAYIGTVPRRLRHTLTVDNGKEFAGFKDIERALDIHIYFARPYCSWQRGINENTNGLLRQYLPKKTDFTHLTQEELQTYVNKLNNRPRKKLGYRTPAQAFNDAIVALRL